VFEGISPNNEVLPYFPVVGYLAWLPPKGPEDAVCGYYPVVPPKGPPPPSGPDG